MFSNYSKQTSFFYELNAKKETWIQNSWQYNSIANVSAQSPKDPNPSFIFGL